MCAFRTMLIHKPACMLTQHETVLKLQMVGHLFAGYLQNHDFWLDTSFQVFLAYCISPSAHWNSNRWHCIYLCMILPWYQHVRSFSCCGWLTTLIFSHFWPFISRLCPLDFILPWCHAGFLRRWVECYLCFVRTKSHLCLGSEVNPGSCSCQKH